MNNVQLEYLDENLNRIMQNPDNILYFRQYDVGNKRALFAMVKEDQGVYRKIQITKEQSKMTFPLDPIYWFYNGPGYFLLKNYLFFYNMLALNTTHLDGFKAKSLEECKLFNVGVFATFDDGSATFIQRERAKKFEKQGGIEPYIDQLKKYKEYNPQYETYEIIECYYNNEDDTFVIPKLQKKVEDQPAVKKLTIKDN